MRRRFLMLCVIAMISTAFATGCGRDGDMNSTQAPYEDEVNDAGSNLEDAGRNLMDSVEDTGNAIKDGVRDITN